MPDFAIDYQLQEVDPSYLTASVKPKQFLHIDQEECILCEGCVDICPWKCIHMVSVSAIAEAVGTSSPVRTPVITWPSSSTRTCAPGARSASTAAPPA
jgi:formate hydrogenlyase subunit 6/NADH:ubiquinone oxidoreductase subunit I